MEQKTAHFLIEYFGIDKNNFNEIYTEKMKNCFFETQHITGLADFIIGDTIIDLKCTSAITETHVKQCLSYYYLSNKLGNDNIKKVMVYDAIKEKYIIIDVETAYVDTNI